MILLAALLGLDGATLACLHAWPDHLAAHLTLYVSAGILWLAVTLIPRRIPAGFLALAFAMHVLALCMAPRHSDDVYRYLWDGEVQRAGLSPYGHAPDDGALSTLRGPEWSRINNRQLPTIYPAGAQLLFAVAASLPTTPLVGWKLLVALGDLATVVLLLRARGRTAAFVWLSAPLVLVELCVNAHIEAVGVALFTAALTALPLRRTLSGVCVGLASATKLLPIYLFSVLRDRRIVLGGVVAIGLAYAPYLGAGTHVVGSLGEYGRRWRSNDGAFAVVQTCAAQLVALGGVRAHTDRLELGRLGPYLTGRDRPQAYPDELAGAIARAIVLVIFFAILWRSDVRTRSWALERRAVRIALVGTGAFLLLTPALHPWYALWLIPPLVLEDASTPVERTGWLWLVALVPLGHVPLVDYLAGQPWRESAPARLCEHLPALLLLATAWLRTTDRRATYEV